VRVARSVANRDAEEVEVPVVDRDAMAVLNGALLIAGES
jgi:polysaccharide deacetylase 2 family uncharacterized protein YibQ